MSRPRVLVNALSMSEGGGRSYVVNFLREVARDDRGFAFTLLALKGQLDDLDTSSVDVDEVSLPPLPGRTVWRVLFEQLVLPLRARRYDLLFCLADISPAFGWTPTVVFLRNLNIYDRRWYDDLRTRTLERLARAGLPRAARVLFPTAAARDLIAERIPVPLDRARVVPHGVATEAFEAASEGEPQSERAYVFLAAAPERHKNVGVLIEAVPYLADADLEVWIAGRSLLDPGHQEALEERARELGIEHRVRFLGPVGYPEVLEYYRHAAAFVFPSFIETFGQPLVEAMLARTPVVASDIPTFREIAGDCALFFPVDDPRALAARIDDLADRAATERRVEIARKRAETYSWRRSIDTLGEVLSEALPGRG